ncbi:unnamed protein product [Mytilus coruscus]|uniref:Endonuclease/exonuclease/phosphatase domain-containing protein n=1 Tax=Mytilus coruscus TaxID=42192 RepID=A0A6J8ED61_MYTCO|nr:unnamed protein product [Mytilus coruscus]
MCFSYIPHEYGNFTFCTANGRSVNDYSLVSPCDYELISNLEVLQLNEFSDHSPLYFELDFTNNRPSHNIPKFHTYIKWDNNENIDYIQLLHNQQDRLLSLVNDISTLDDVNDLSKKKSKSKSTKDNSSVNTGDCTGDIANVNKTSNTPFTPNALDTTNTSVGMSQQNFSQDPNFIYPYNPGPNAGFMTQNQHLCSSPTPRMYPSPIHHMQHVSPPAKPASTQQRPTWVDELFRRMDKFENKLNKLDQIDSFVTSLNAKVIRLERGTKSL